MTQRTNPRPHQIAASRKLWNAFVGSLGCPEDFDDLTFAARVEYATALLGDVVDDREEKHGESGHGSHVPPAIRDDRTATPIEHGRPYGYGLRFNPDREFEREEYS